MSGRWEWMGFCLLVIERIAAAKVDRVVREEGFKILCV
jgi:hypothetical protein